MVLDNSQAEGSLSNLQSKHILYSKVWFAFELSRRILYDKSKALDRSQFLLDRCIHLDKVNVLLD